MTTVYIDPNGTLVEPPPGGMSATSAATAAPEPGVGSGAVEAVRRLIDEGYDVVVLADAPIRAIEDTDLAVRYAADPATGPARSRDAAAQAWLIAADTRWSDRPRPPGLRTIRVGPRQPQGRRTAARFDVEARDLGSAVMEILVRDAMAG